MKRSSPKQLKTQRGAVLGTSFLLPALLGDSVTLRKTGKHLPSIPKAKTKPKWRGRCSRHMGKSTAPRAKGLTHLTKHSLEIYIKLWMFYGCLQSLWSLCMRTTSKLLSVRAKQPVYSQVCEKTSKAKCMREDLNKHHWSTITALWESDLDKGPVSQATRITTDGNPSTPVEGPLPSRPLPRLCRSRTILKGRPRLVFLSPDFRMHNLEDLPESLSEQIPLCGHTLNTPPPQSIFWFYSLTLPYSTFWCFLLLY